MKEDLRGVLMEQMVAKLTAWAYDRGGIVA